MAGSPVLAAIASLVVVVDGHDRIVDLNPAAEALLGRSADEQARPKTINDTYGHAVGDLVLQHSARRMRDALRPGDLAGRIGGDELAAILFAADETVAEQVTGRLRQAIAEPLDVNGQPLTLSAGIGHVTTWTVVDAEQLLIRADDAMYADKRSRR